MLIGAGTTINAGINVAVPLPAPYSAITSSSSVNEGSTITFTSTSTGVPDGTLYWSRYGGAANDADFSAVNGSFTVTDGVGTFTVTPVADRLTEGTELFSVVVRTGSITGPIIGTSAGKEILDTSLDPTYSLATAGSVSSINEGTALTFNVTTTEVDDGTTLYYTADSTGSYELEPIRFSGGSAQFSTGKYFTGTGNSGLTLDGDFTIETWIKCGAQPNPFPTLIAQNGVWGSNATQFYICVSHTGANNVIGLYNDPEGGDILTGSIVVTDNVWHHIAVVRLNGVITLYVDGVADGTYSSNFTVDYSNFAIGSNPSDGGASVSALSYTGLITNLRIVKGTALYTSAFTPVTSPLPAISGTQLLLLESANNRLLADSSTNNFTITNNGSVAWSSVSPFDGTTGSFTVNSNAGTFTITVSADSFTATGTQLYNIVLATSLDPTSLVGNTVGVTVNDTSQDPTYTLATDDSSLNVDEGTAVTFNVTTTDVVDGTTLYWYTGSTGTYGLTQGRFSPSATGSFTVNSNSGTFTITVSADTTTATGTQIYQVELSTTYPSPTRVGNALNITVNDTSQTPPVRGSAVFNQPQTDYVSLPALPDWNLGTTWTVEFWIYMNSSSIGGNQSGGIWGLLNQKGWATTDSINIALSGGYLQINQGNNTAYYNKYIPEPTPLQWVHVAIVNNAGTNKVYYNGIEQIPPAGISSQDYTASWTNSTNPLYIGSLGDSGGGAGSGGSTFDGKLTNLRITDRAEYLTNFYPPTVLPTRVTNHTRLLWTPTDQALATDTSDDPHTITNTGVTYSSSYPATNNTRGSAVFDGSTKRYYKVPGGSHLQLGTTWTIEWWQKSTSTTTSGQLYTVMSQAPDGGRIDIYYQNGNLVVQNGQTLCAEPAIDVWVHVAIVNNAGVGTVYYDGVAQAATGNFGNYGQAQDLYIGKRGNNNFQYFNGKLTNIRITDTAVYTSNFVPDQLPTVVASHTKLLLRPTVDTIYGVDEGNLGLAISSSGATYSSDYAPVTNTYTARTYNEVDQYAGGYSGNAIKVYIPDYPDILNVPNGATIVLTGQTSGTFTVGSGLPFSQATTTLYVRNLAIGLGTTVYGGDNLTFTWRT